MESWRSQYYMEILTVSIWTVSLSAGVLTESSTSWSWSRSSDDLWLDSSKNTESFSNDVWGKKRLITILIVCMTTCIHSSQHWHLWIELNRAAGHVSMKINHDGTNLEISKQSINTWHRSGGQYLAKPGRDLLEVNLFVSRTHGLDLEQTALIPMTVSLRSTHTCDEDVFVNDNFHLLLRVVLIF